MLQDVSYISYIYILHSLSGIPDGRKMRQTNAPINVHSLQTTVINQNQKAFKIYSLQEFLIELQNHVNYNHIHSGYSRSCGSRSVPGREVLCGISPVYCHSEYLLLNKWFVYIFLFSSWLSPITPFLRLSQQIFQRLTLLKRFIAGEPM